VTRLPFDPAKMAAARSAPPGTDSAPLTVAQVAERIDAALRTGLPTRIRVVGEVSNFTDRTHWYFDLKDPTAVVNCVMFAAAARKSGLRLQDGLEVVVSGRVEFYARGGRVSFIVDKVEPVGEGALDLAFRKLCEEIRALGWFDPARKKPLPVFPRRIAVITSRTGAALQDVINTIARRCPAVGVLVVDVRVQGEGAAADVAKAIAEVASRRSELGVDAILVTRGGGSKEDLWAFNERVVAEAIVRCPLPVVAAIGHETDTTIAELVADERAATPTQAAMRLTPETAALTRQAESVARRLASLLGRRFDLERQKVASLGRHPVLFDPARRLREIGRSLEDLRRRQLAAAKLGLGAKGQRLARGRERLERSRPTALQARMASRLATLFAGLHASARASAYSGRTRAADLQARLLRASQTSAASQSSRLESLLRQLALVSPQHVLDRGYSVTLGPDGRALRSASGLQPGDRVTTRLAVGVFQSRVELAPDVPPAGLQPPTLPTPSPLAAMTLPKVVPSPQPQRKPTAPPARPKEPPKDQMDLFAP
jgi:exodeoxyribonuclease VII large subunit